MGHPASQGLRRHVHELDLFSGAHDRVGHGLALHDPRDSLDHVIERFEVLDVHRGDHGDTGREQFVDVLPALGMATTGHVRMRELVDECELRRARQNRVEIHLLEALAAVLDDLARNHFEVTQLRSGEGSTMRLDECDDDVRAALQTAPALVEHGEGLADPRRRTDVDPERAARHLRQIRRLTGSSCRAPG